MTTPQEHYARLLAPLYSWVHGGHDAMVAANLALFRAWDLRPRGSGKAVDLGCGSGFQSLALAQLGFQVRALDTDPVLLAELQERAGTLPVHVEQADLRGALSAPGDVELAVCMGDTLTHLPSAEDVDQLVHGAAAHLAPGGRLVLTYRDLSVELQDLDRLMPVRQDAERLFLCFLEYESSTHARVNDILVTKDAAGWRVDKSCYRKLRLPRAWVVQRLEAAGLVVERDDVERGWTRLLARRP